MFWAFIAMPRKSTGSSIASAPARYGGSLGDILGQVAHPLQIVVDLQRGDDEPQIVGHRLIEGQDFQALFLDLDLHAIDHRVVGDHLLGHHRVAIDESRDGVGDRLFDQRADVEDFLLQAVDLAVDMLGHGAYLAAAARMGRRAAKSKRSPRPRK